jgi:aryl-alcohol dehydrogenase-like predicted oxidoreductase
MEYRRLGSTGLKLSRLALGCGNFGGIGLAFDLRRKPAAAAPT